MHRISKSLIKSEYHADNHSIHEVQELCIRDDYSKSMSPALLCLNSEAVQRNSNWKERINTT
jgi:hypothetical protein